MNRRTALLAVIFAFAGSAVHGQELQFNVSGELCFIVSPIDGCGGPSDFTASFLLSTRSAQLSPTFGPLAGSNALVVLDGTVSITNLSGEFGGQPQPFVPSSIASLQMLLNGGTGGPYQFSLFINPQPGYDLMAVAEIPAITQAQYQAFKNPLYSIVTSFPSPIGGTAPFAGGVDDLTTFSFTEKISVVPEPAVLTLLLLALAGIWLTRRRRA